MKKAITHILFFCSIVNSAFGNCDWKTGITPGPNKTFIYSEECHQEVGKLVQANKDLTAAIQLRDLAIKYDEERIALWSKTAGDEQDRLSKMDSIQHHSDILYFALGVATTFAAAYTASRIYH